MYICIYTHWCFWLVCSVPISIPTFSYLYLCLLCLTLGKLKLFKFSLLSIFICLYVCVHWDICEYGYAYTLAQEQNSEDNLRCWSCLYPLLRQSLCFYHCVHQVGWSLSVRGFSGPYLHHAVEGQGLEMHTTVPGSPSVLL